MPRSPEIYLQDILDAISRIEAYIGELDEDLFGKINCGLMVYYST